MSFSCFSSEYRPEATAQGLHADEGRSAASFENGEDKTQEFMNNMMNNDM